VLVIALYVAFLISFLHSSIPTLLISLIQRCKTAVRFVSFSANGKYIIYCSHDGMIFIWSIKAKISDDENK
jgi:WD40 repeat protein